MKKRETIINELNESILIQYLPCKLNVKKDGMGLIQNIKYESVESPKLICYFIQSFIDIFKNFRKFSNRVVDIIDL